MVPFFFGRRRVVIVKRKIKTPQTNELTIHAVHPLFTAAGSNTAQTALATASGPVPGPGPDTVVAAAAAVVDEQGRDENVHVRARADTAVVAAVDSDDDGAERPPSA